ncbi:DNA-3-methyladenine glycosylase I [Trifolium repens]|nr:DNA-3-methyladenine glycosylase I [Trifolium repens]
MCSSKAKVTIGIESSTTPSHHVARINGRPVLQPTCNHVVPNLERRNSIKKLTPKSLSPLPLPIPNKTSTTTTSLTPPISPKPKSPTRPLAIKRVNDNNGMNLSCEKLVIPKNTMKTPSLERKKSKSFKEGSFEFFLLILQMFWDSKTTNEEEKRCSFITANSDPIYIAYHDEEWGVPVHDDKMLFELLILSGAQVGSDWTSTLKKRLDFRAAFSEFDAEIVANLTDKQMISISSEYGIDISKVRGVVDNANQILQVKKSFGSFDKYIWGFVNHKPISTQYKFGHKIPVKTSKSESISKDMIRRGFRFVGPTVVHSFMQAAGLTNDHLITCHRHLQCNLMVPI